MNEDTQNTHGLRSNSLGVTPHFFEKIMQLRYLTDETIRAIQFVQNARKTAVEYVGKPKGEIAKEQIPNLIASAQEWLTRLCIHVDSFPHTVEYFDFDTNETT